MTTPGQPLNPLRVPAREIPPPASISPAARAYLSATAAVPAGSYPPEGDRQAWEAWVRQADAALAASWHGRDFEDRARCELADLGGVPTYVITPLERDAELPDAVLLDIHGGALVMGGGELARGMCLPDAVTCGVVTYAVDYRMPPAHPYPAPLDDCVAAYRALLARVEPWRIVVRGGSAGGNLAAALVLRARDEGLPLPAGLVLGTPELDLTETGDSFQTHLGLDSVLTRSLMPANRLYANGHDLAHPWLSPLFGDFTKGFPPTCLYAGTRDLFLSNAARMQRALRDASVPCELIVCEGMPHGGFFGAPEDQVLAADVAGVSRRFWQQARPHHRNLAL